MCRCFDNSRERGQFRLQCYGLRPKRSERQGQRSGKSAPGELSAAHPFETNGIESRLRDLFLHCRVESKRGRISRVKYWKTTLSILAALSASLTLADDFKTVNGKEYKNATVSRVEPDGIVIRTKSGISKVYFSELPEDVARRFHSTEAGNGSDSNAEGLATNEREAAAILTKAQEEFEAAEMRAALACKNIEKGTLSGQIFIATKGRQNVKLGATSVNLFDRGAVDILLEGLYTFVTAKSHRLRFDLTAAEAAERDTKAAAE